jgi:cysteinyl-tRNA synthetase
MNLTDVDDKIIRGAREKQISLREFTDPFVEAFFEDLDTLRIQRAEFYPRATDYIQEMVDLVKKLEAEGHTYESEGSIYFRISTFQDYGKLSGIRPEDMMEGARIDSDEYEKDDARDFVLWKAAKPNEVSWETELGVGRPGWHLECSAMSTKLLGNTFDIHTGGVDNVFPHHENEIAQSEGATGEPFARFWLHAEHLTVESEKMAKSKGNFFTLRELIEKGFDPVTIRYLLLSVPYRQKLNFTFDGLHAAGQAIERLENFSHRLDHTPPCSGKGDLQTDAVTEFQHEFKAALGDDLNTAKALGALHNFVRLVNTALDGAGLTEAVKAEVEKALGEADSVLDVFPTADEEPGADDETIQNLVDERTAARKNKDFARADEIRDELTAKGIVIEDTPHGPIWKREK